MESRVQYVGSWSRSPTADAERSGRDALAIAAEATSASSNQRLARALGWFSVGLGLTELLAPRGLARLMGIRAEPNVLRALGVRELASGVAILAQQRPSAVSLRARVAGDAIDLGLMAAAWNARKTDRVRLAASAGAVLGVTALDILCSRRLSLAATTPQPLEINTSVAIQSQPERLYRFLRDLSNLPRVFSHIQAIDVGEGGHFRVQGKRVLGRALSWDAQITKDVPSKRLAWHTLPGSALAHSARIQFKPLSAEGTLLSVDMRFEPLAAALVAPLARMLGDAPKQGLKNELRRFKQWIETGEVATTEGQSAGRRSLVSRYLP